MTDDREKERPSVRMVKPDGTRELGTWHAEDVFVLEGRDVKAGQEIQIEGESWEVVEVRQETVRDPEAPDSEGEVPMERKRQVQFLTVAQPSD